MDSTIKCKYCGRDIEITEALKHQIEEQVLDIEREKHKNELQDAIKKAQETAIKKTKDDSETFIKQLQETANEEKERSKKMSEQITELMRELRKTKQKIRT